MNDKFNTGRPRHARILGLGLIVLALGLLIAMSAPTAQAADIRSGDRVVIEAGTVIDDDLFVSGDEIIIDGTVKGDVYALGNTVTINGTVEHDVLAAGQSIVVNGNVGDTLRAAAQTIELGNNAKIAHTALLGAFAIETKPNSVVQHDLIFGAFQGLLGGTVQHDVIAGANGIELDGTVGRNMRVSLGDDNNRGMSPAMFMPNMRVTIPNVPAGLTLGTAAKIGGDLVYESSQPVNVPGGAQVTGPIVQQTPVPDMAENAPPPTPEQIQAQQNQQTVNYFLDAGRRFIVLLLIGLVVLWLLPRWIQGMADFIQTKPLGSFGRGILMFVGYLVATVALLLVGVMVVIILAILTLGSFAGAVVLVGTVLFGMLTVGYYVFVSYVAPIVVSYFGGRLLFSKVQAPWAQNRYLAFFVGLILLTLISLIPVLNVIVGWLVALFALGALLLWLAPRFERKPDAAMQTAPA